MRRKRLVPWLLILALAPAVRAESEVPAIDEQPVLDIDWQTGPDIADLGSIAQVAIPESYVFAGGEDTRRLMELMENPPSGAELGFMAPVEEDWFLVFEFEDIGYVKDDEKDSLDADAMLASIREGTEQGNKEREARGWATMTIVGWEVPPSYNEATHNLEWAIRGSSQDKVVVNHNTRVLGRRGVMVVTLVASPEEMPAVLPRARELLAGFSFLESESYAAFRSGDKVAQYGLTALVVGGATAVAAKSGLLKSLWKVLVLAAVAVAGFVRRLFSRRREVAEVTTAE